MIPDDWKTDTLVTVNVNDVLREVEQYTADIVTDCRLFDGRPMEQRSDERSPLKGSPKASKRQQPESDSADSDSSE